MRIVDTSRMAKFRFEYRIEYMPPGQVAFTRKLWRLFLEGVVERVTPDYFEDIRGLLPEGHPAHTMARHIYGAELDSLLGEVLPFKPFAPHKTLVDMMGLEFLERVARDPRDRKIWSSDDGWTWYHIAGDAIT